MRRRAYTRREIVKAAGTVAAAGMLPRPVRAARKMLRIVQWNHFVPGYDRWFNDQYVKEWGEKNDTDVIVDNVGVRALNAAAAAEVSAKKGHDLFLFLWPKPVYEDDVVDHREIYEECERKFGKPIDLAIKSTYNPKTKKYFGFSDSYVPDPINWRKSLFDEIGMQPDTWDDIRVAGRKIKEKRGIPVGIGLAPETDTSMAMRSILYSFGGSEQDEAGKLTLGSKNTLEAVKFVKALFQETMSPEVFSWDESSNNRAMLAGRASVVLNAISITREAENKNLLVDGKPIGDDIWLAKAARGPVRRMGLEHVMNVYVIWKFAENVEGAKKFLVDYIGNFHRAFEASEFYNFPCFRKQVPDLDQMLAKDTKGKPPNKYAVLSDSLDWATNVGYPGYANAAIDDIYSQFILNNMFAKAAQGVLSPEDAVKEAEAKARDIFLKWKERKLL